MKRTVFNLIVGGDLNTFLPIVVNPREVTSSSDLTLQDALNLLTNTGANTGQRRPQTYFLSKECCQFVATKHTFLNAREWSSCLL